jgi:hypothetical protein
MSPAALELTPRTHSCRDGIAKSAASINGKSKINGGRKIVNRQGHIIAGSALEPKMVDLLDVFTAPADGTCLVHLFL